MGYQGHGDAGDAFGVITDRVGAGLVQKTLSADPAAVGLLGDEEVVLRSGQPAARGKGEGSAGEQQIGFEGTQSGHERVHLRQVTRQFVAEAEHHKRGMITVFAEDTVSFVLEPVIHRRILSHLERPVGQFDLEIETDLVGQGESDFWGTPGVKPQMVQTVGPGRAKDLFPLAAGQVGMSGLRELGAMDRASEEHRLAIDGEPATGGFELAETERFGETRGGGAVSEQGTDGVRDRLEFRPTGCRFRQRQEEFPRRFARCQDHGFEGELASGRRG